ncbi:MAG: hypothetical protein ACI9BF_000834 [Candidatus Paceibacteria bacterium]|jgi:hypothetical protein
MVKYVIVAVPTLRETEANNFDFRKLQTQNMKSVRGMRKKRKPFRNNKLWLRGKGRPIH